MAPPASPFILIDGIARSGTSLLARILERALAPLGYAYYFEPLQHPTPVGRFEPWRGMTRAILMPGDPAPELEAYLERMRSSAAGPLLWKEIRFELKQDWLLARFPDLKIVHIARDILGVASSHRRAGAPPWMENHRRIWIHALRAWFADRLRLEQKLAGAFDPPKSLDGLGEFQLYALLWAMNEAFANNLGPADRILRLRHEDLTLAPEAAARKLAAFLGIEFSPLESAAREEVAKTGGASDASGPGPGGAPEAIPEIWRKRLAWEEIAEIEAVAGSIRAGLGYPAVR